MTPGHPSPKRPVLLRWGPLLAALGGASGGCLLDRDLYEARKAALSDGDGDGYSAADGDCDDGDARIRPGAPESCDGVDEDCDGVVDDGATDATTWFLDGDGDGAGDSDEHMQACAPPTASWVSTGDDCDDDNATRHPTATETPYDGVDQDCDGVDERDVDGDGSEGAEVGGPDCDDTDAAVHPGADETWENLLKDNDCDEEIESLELVYGSDPWFGTMEDARLGPRMEPLGDVDGDGTTEFLAVTILASPVGDYAGRIYLLGQDEPGSVADLPHVDPPAATSGLGASMAAVPDTDGDGVVDFVTGATLMGGGAGRVFLLSTGALVEDGVLQVPDDASATVEGQDEGTFFGSSVASLDLDGDGVHELVVGEPFAAPPGAALGGRVYVFEGELDGTRTTADADHRLDGSFADMRLGNALADAGDQDGDGRTDLMVSGEFGLAAAILTAEGLDGDVEDAALVRIYDGTAEAPEPVMVGDLDGDGRRDLVVMRDQAQALTDLAGAVVTDLDPDGPALTSGDGSLFYQAEDLGDLDGDGRAETLLTIPDYVADGGSWAGLLPGAEWPEDGELVASALPFRAIPTRRDAFLGQRARLVGDVDGDGRVDLAIGGYSGDRGANNSGSVALLPVPE